MHTGEKKRTIGLLEKLRLFNYKSAYIYKIIAENENRLILKNFYRKLYEQKLEFLDDIETRIEDLKHEISPILDPRLLSFYRRKKCELSHLYLKYKVTHKYAHIHKRELKGLQRYRTYLSQVNHSLVREMLLKHKHKLRKNINEMNNTGVMKFPVA